MANWLPIAGHCHLRCGGGLADPAYHGEALQVREEEVVMMGMMVMILMRSMMTVRSP
jgi:hypothetical protein